MGTREGKKISSPAPEPKLSKVNVIFHTNSGNEFEVSIGECDASQVNAVQQSITNAMATLRQTNDMVLAAADGTTYHFNVDNVECVRVKVD